MIKKVLVVLFVLVFSNVSFCETKISNSEDVACMILMLKQELALSNDEELRSMSEVCQSFIDEYYSYNAHIRFFPKNYKKNNIGLFQPHQKAIYLKRNISEKALRVTLVHELTHYKQYLESPELIKDLCAFSYSKNVKGVLSMEAEAHRNALLYYYDSFNVYDEAVSGWEKMLNGFSQAYFAGKEVEYLSKYYQ